MGWTKWRKIVDKGCWYDEEFDYGGPACYELGIGGPRGGDIKIVYVGETKNEKKRMQSYASHGSHLSDIIDNHLKRGFSLFYRAQARETKEAAVKTQDSLLRVFQYPWNITGNLDHD